MIHVGICIIVVVLAVAAFLDIDNRYFLFPVVFLLTAVLNFVNGIARFGKNRTEDSGVLPGTVLLVMGIVMLLLTVVSAYVTWRTMS